MTLQDGQVYAAFDILLEELESMANAAHKNLERLLMEREYDALREGLEVVTRIEEFREKVRMLREEWAAQFPKLAREGTQRYDIFGICKIPSQPTDYTQRTLSRKAGTKVRKNRLVQAPE